MHPGKGVVLKKRLKCGVKRCGVKLNLRPRRHQQLNFPGRGGAATRDQYLLRLEFEEQRQCCQRLDTTSSRTILLCVHTTRQQGHAGHDLLYFRAAGAAIGPSVQGAANRIDRSTARTNGRLDVLGAHAETGTDGRAWVLSVIPGTAGNGRKS